MTAHIDDVAAYILDKFEKPLSTTKMQALVYLANGWSLGLTDKPLVDESFYAHSIGPLSLKLFEHHKKEFSLVSWPLGNVRLINELDQIVIDAVVNNYGGLSGGEIVSMEHVKGKPWALARARKEKYIEASEIHSHFKTILL